MELQKGKVYLLQSGYQAKNYYIPLYSQGDEPWHVHAVYFKYMNIFGEGFVWKHIYTDKDFFDRLIEAPPAMQVLYGNL